MIFTYWDAEDLSPVAAQAAEWREAFANYRVMTPGQARALLAIRSRRHLDAFDRTRIPACRSDIARLLGLAVHGGLYVDSHCRLDDAEEVRRRLDQLATCDMIVSTRWAPNFGKVMPHNSILWSRPQGAAVDRLLDLALDNLAARLEREDRVGFEPYHVWDITGPGVFWRELFDATADDGVLKPGWAACVDTVFETDNPVTRHIHTGYREPGSHWSERQKAEPLFSPRAAP